MPTTLFPTGLRLLLACAMLLAWSGQPLYAQAAKPKIALALIDFYLPTRPQIEEQKRQPRAENPIAASHASAHEIHLRLQRFQGYVSDVFGTDGRFVLVERKALQLVQKERELQKSEEFIDGYVVGQGKNIGADYLLTGDFDLASLSLTLSLFSVADQATVAKEVIEVGASLLAVNKPQRDPVELGARRLGASVFPLLMSVVEPSEVTKKGQVKSLLIAGGLKRGLKKGQVLDIKIQETRENDGAAQTYYRTVGQAEVLKVEDDNFSIVTIKNGAETVKTLLDSGQKLYCTFVL